MQRFCKDLQRIHKKTVFVFDNCYNLTASDPLKHWKKCFDLIKMTVDDQLKINDNKVNANEAQYDLDRLAAKISGYSSGH